MRSLLLLFMLMHGKPTMHSTMWLSAVQGDTIAMCDGDSKNCRLIGQHTLDDVVRYFENQTREYSMCGEYGPWILDQNGNVMFRQKNPPCPKVPKP